MRLRLPGVWLLLWVALGAAPAPAGVLTQDGYRMRFEGEGSLSYVDGQGRKARYVPPSRAP